MQELYNQALRCYQQNDYEGALQLLRKCEVSSQVNALQNECTNALRAQYKYLIDEAIKSGDTSSIKEYANKYQTYIGMDSYIESITNSATNRTNIVLDEEIEQQPWYDQEIAGMELKYILGVLAVAALAVVLYLNFGGQNNKVEQAPAEDTVSVCTEEQSEPQIEENTSPDPSLDNFEERLTADDQFVYKDYDTHYVFFINSQNRLMAYSSYNDKIIDVGEECDIQMDYALVKSFSICPDGNGFLLAVAYGGSFPLEGLYRVQTNLTCTCMTPLYCSVVDKLQDGYVLRKCINDDDIRFDDSDNVENDVYLDFDGNVKTIVKSN